MKTLEELAREAGAYELLFESGDYDAGLRFAVLVRAQAMAEAAKICGAYAARAPTNTVPGMYRGFGAMDCQSALLDVAREAGYGAVRAAAQEK